MDQQSPYSSLWSLHHATCHVSFVSYVASSSCVSTALLFALSPRHLFLLVPSSPCGEVVSSSSFCFLNGRWLLPSRRACLGSCSCCCGGCCLCLFGLWKHLCRDWLWCQLGLGLFACPIGLLNGFSNGRMSFRGFDLFLCWQVVRRFPRRYEPRLSFDCMILCQNQLQSGQFLLDVPANRRLSVGHGPHSVNAAVSRAPLVAHRLVWVQLYFCHTARQTRHGLAHLLPPSLLFSSLCTFICLHVSLQASRAAPSAFAPDFPSIPEPAPLWTGSAPQESAAFLLPTCGSSPPTSLSDEHPSLYRHVSSILSISKRSISSCWTGSASSISTGHTSQSRCSSDQVSSYYNRS